MGKELDRLSSIDLGDNQSRDGDLIESPSPSRPELPLGVHWPIKTHTGLAEMYLLHVLHILLQVEKVFYFLLLGQSMRCHLCIFVTLLASVMSFLKHIYVFYHWCQQ